LSEQSFTAHMPLLREISAFGLGKKVLEFSATVLPRRSVPSVLNSHSKSESVSVNQNETAGRNDDCCSIGQLESHKGITKRHSLAEV